MLFAGLTVVTRSAPGQARTAFMVAPGKTTSLEGPGRMSSTRGPVTTSSETDTARMWSLAGSGQTRPSAPDLGQTSTT